MDPTPSDTRLAAAERVELARLLADPDARAGLARSAGYLALTSSERVVGVGGAIARDLYERQAKGTAVVVAIDAATADRVLASVRARWDAIATAIGVGLEHRMPYVTDEEIASCDAARARMRDVTFVLGPASDGAPTEGRRALTVVFVGGEAALPVGASWVYLDAPIRADELAAMREATVIDFAGFVSLP